MEIRLPRIGQQGRHVEQALPGEVEGGRQRRLQGTGTADGVFQVLEAAADAERGRGHDHAGDILVFKQRLRQVAGDVQVGGVQRYQQAPAGLAGLHPEHFIVIIPRQDLL